MTDWPTAQVPEWRGCYNDFSEYKRLEATSNLPKFAEKIHVGTQKVKMNIQYQEIRMRKAQWKKEKKSSLF